MPVTDGTNRLETFVRQAEAAGSVLHRLDGPDAVAPALLALAGPAPSVALTGPVRSAVRGLAAALSAGGARLVSPGDGSALASADLGVSLAPAAVAETGSVLLTDAQPADRLAGMLPPVHAVLLDPAHVVPGLTEMAAILRARALEPSYASFITGPSRTADIERTLTIGVHGPRQLHILLTPGVSGG